jgi:hypothetical protein
MGETPQMIKDVPKITVDNKILLAPIIDHIKRLGK